MICNFGCVFDENTQTKKSMLSFPWQIYWYVVLIIGIAIIILMVLIVFLCNRVIPTDNPWDQEVERFKKRSSVYVKLQRKRYRGSMAPGMHPPPIESHPDHVVEHRATPF